MTPDGSIRTVLVIGAGMTGLAAARALRARGLAVTVVEKARVPGGRIGTRRVLNGDADRDEHTDLAFDHGAQYFTARDPHFLVEVEAWVKAGAVRPWTPALAAFDSEGREPLEDTAARWVGVPGMSAVARHLARDLDVRCAVRVASLTPAGPGGAWHAATADGGSLGPHDAVIVTTPAPEAVPLLGHSPQLAAEAAAVRMHPCWAVMAAFESRVSTPFDAAFVTSSPLGWIARDRSKPARGLAETWVLHAAGPWSAAHLDDHADAVGPFLLNAFADLVRAPLPRPVHLSTHRWRLACADPPLGRVVLIDADRRVAVAGDWCNGNRVEGAFLSGQAAADAVVAMRVPPSD